MDITMNMHLTLQEEKEFNNDNMEIKINNLKSKSKYKPRFVCSLGHELSYVFFRSYKDKIIKRLSNRFYCIKCRKEFNQDGKEVIIQ